MCDLQKLVFWYDGSARSSTTLELSITDPGLLYGATVFTTLRIYGASLHHPLTYWTRHCDRLRQTIEALGWTAPDWTRITQGAQWAMQFYPVLRITLFPDGREWITGRPLPPDLAQRQQQGITAWVVDRAWQRSLPEYKTGNYLAPWLALQTAHTQGAQEAILTDDGGSWQETSTGNLWGYREGQWYTPPLAAGILPGIQRQAFLTSLATQGISVDETPWDRSFVQTLDGIAYSNCVVELIPIQHVIMGSERFKCSLDPLVWQTLRSNFFSKAQEEL